MKLKFFINKILSRNYIVISIIVLFSFCFFCATNTLFADPVDFYNNDLYYSRYWQGLDKNMWEDWQLNYTKNILNTNDILYKKYTGNAIFTQIENKAIINRPLIVWFAFQDGTISNPEIVVSSGSNKYDKYWCEVITGTTINSFPATRQRIFLWEGDIIDVVDYLKSKNVLPDDYKLEKWITPADVHWEKI